MMRAIKKMELPPFEIFRGKEEDFYKNEFILKVADNAELKFSYSDFHKNNLEKMVSHLGKKNFDEVISKSGFRFANDLLPFYKGNYNLPLNYCICEYGNSNRCAVVLCFEEVQPLIYALFIEAVWTIYDISVSS